MKTIGDLPPIGTSTLAKLHEAGVTSLSQLRELGPANAFLLMRSANSKVGTQFLWLLDRVLTNVPQTTITFERRAAAWANALLHIFTVAAVS